MIDYEEEEKYKQSTSISVQYGANGETKIIDALTRRSTVFEVLHRLMSELELKDGNWVFVEVWRGVERPLPPRTRILRVWHAWCNEQRHVTFKLQRAKPQQAHFHQHPKKRRRPLVKGPGRFVGETWGDTDSVSSDSSDSMLDDSLNTSDSDSENEESREAEQRLAAISRIKEMDQELKFITEREHELDERIRATERTIHLNSLSESIQDYKDQTQLLEARLCSTKLTIVGLEQSVREAEKLSGLTDAEIYIQNERLRLEAEIQHQIRINDRLEQEAVELDRERLQLADSVLARQRILSQVGLSPAHAPPSELSDSEFYSSNLLEVSLENSFSSRTGLNGTVGRFTDVSQMSQRTGSDDDDADDEDQSDLSDTGRLSSRDSFDFTANQNAAEAEALPSGHTATATAAEQAGHCYKCNDCAKISRNGRNRQSGSSDSGNVSDDSKITNSSLGDSFSFTDSAISSISSQETERKDEKNLSIIEQIEKSEKPQLWKRTESTDNESDVFNSREIYADQLRKNSQIIRQASVRKQKLIKPEKQVIESKIIETLV